MDLKRKFTQTKHKKVILAGFLFVGILSIGIVLGILLSNTIQYTWNVETTTSTITVEITDSPVSTLYTGVWYNNSFSFNTTNNDKDNAYNVEVVFVIVATGITTSDIVMCADQFNAGGNCGYDELTFTQVDGSTINATFSQWLEQQDTLSDHWFHTLLYVQFAPGAPTVGWTMDINVIGDPS